ncbi:hypothetical protein LUU34_01111500 [Aix galericulata]|nr:hypothetical protein LUU34_01111500 [Aix galericulata]
MAANATTNPSQLLPLGEPGRRHGAAVLPPGCCSVPLTPAGRPRRLLFWFLEEKDLKYKFNTVVIYEDMLQPVTPWSSSKAC